MTSSLTSLCTILLDHAVTDLGGVGGGDSERVERMAVDKLLAIWISEAIAKPNQVPFVYNTIERLR